ncbi:complement C3-like [Sinocyclocheilus grahami]|uniref:complement C3-like n=1 Tax=Sinocyclocheilus grahami TaxID=75366 RepID=UPI0007AD37BD|nr:PREDICTED: complement C3-like [Sinocyclocheilus grahami]
MEVKLLFLTVVLLSSPLLTLCDPLFVLSAPNLLRVGSSENLLVEAQDYSGAALDVTIIVKNHPKKSREILSKSVTLTADNNFQILTDIKIPDDQNFFSDDPLEKQYVYLQAQFPSVTLEQVVMLSFHSGYIFVQTDKPIYTPASNVLYRIFSLMPNLKPLNESKITVEIMNPQGITVSSENITTALHIEYHHYVRPTVNVSDQIKCDRLYLFGQKVDGNAFVVFGVMEDEKKTSTSLQKVQIVEGEGTAELTNQMITDTFPNINQLVGRSIYVSVSLLTESGSEMVEAERRGIQIVTSPYTIHFKKTPPFFKPGMPFSVSVYVTNPDQTPAVNVKVEVNPGGVRGQTKDNGIVKVKVNTLGGSSTLDITAKTKDPEIEDNQQAVRKMTAQAYETKGGSNNYLHIGIDAAELQIGDSMTVNLNTGQIPGVRGQDFTYMILSKGQIVKADRFKRSGESLVTLSLPVTKDMVPSFRFVAYYHVGSSEVVSDSVWVDVKDTCMGKLQLEVKEKMNTYGTGEEVKLQITGDPGAKVGLVVVDKAVQVLNKKRLTQTQIWDVIEKHDTGCTAGGGRDSMGVFTDAGLMFASHTAGGTNTRTVPECPVPAKRKRRSESLLQITSTLAGNYSGELKQCCVDGMRDNKLGYTCERRATYIIDGEECVKAFLDCCNQMITRKNTKTEEEELIRARSDDDDDDDDYYTDSEDIVSRTQFPESWLWEVVDLPTSNKGGTTSITKPIVLKDSITTWQILAVSLSPTLGICVAEPEEMVVFKRFFIDLKIPYSAVRGEQLEIKAIIHNYTPIVFSAGNYSGELKQCCVDGMRDNKLGYTCERRATYIIDGEECVKAFLDCCNQMITRKNTKTEEEELIRARSDDDDDDDDYYTDSEDIVSRTQFPESWLWEVVDLPTSNKGGTTSITKPIVLKDSITTWQILAVSLSPTLGICVAEPEEMVVFKSFFIDLKMPYSAVRGEQLEIKAIIHNYTPKKHKVRVEFMETEDVCSSASKKGKYRTTVSVDKGSSIAVSYVIIPMMLGSHMIEVNASAFGLSDGVRKPLKVVVRLMGNSVTFFSFSCFHQVRVEFMETEDVCSSASKKGKYRTTVSVDKGSSIAVSYVIIPMMLGSHMIEVNASAFGLSDGVRKPLKVVSEGVLISHRENVELNPVKNGEKPLVFKSVIPTGRLPDTPADTYIAITAEEITQTVEQAISGDFMGRLIVQPTGCGEQNMIYMTLPLIATHYLDSTNQWDTVGMDRRNEAVNHIRTGYQRQLVYRKSDGSYAAWRHRPSSTWLTAYVAKVFSMANNLVSIEENVICSALKWLILHKQIQDGSFKEGSAVIHGEMVGDVQGKDADASLTAFVVIAMQEAREICAESVASLQESIRKAVSFLEGRLPQLTNPYAVAMTSYAMANANKLNKDILMKSSSQLKADRSWTVPGQHHHSLEATAYAVLALVKDKDFDKAGEAVHWLNRQQSHYGGSGTTQATIMVFQAVAEYRTQVKDRQNFNLDVELSVAGRSKPVRYTIKRENAHLTRSDRVEINQEFNVTAKGTGTATLSVLTQYYARPVEKKSDCTFFDLTVKMEKDNEAKQGVVASYKLTMDFYYKDDKTDATMTILDFGLPTGFEVEESDLKELSSGKERYIQKYEKNKVLSERGSLILYLDKVLYVSKMWCLIILKSFILYMI